MSRRHSLNCITPPHILRKLLENTDAGVREVALETLLATSRLRAERHILAEFGYVRNSAGEKRRTIYDCKNRRLLTNAVLIRGEGDEEVDDKTINRAYNGLGQTYDFFKAVHKRNSIDNQGMRLDAYVHFSRSYNNAFWNGRQMVFGDGDGRIFADFTKSLDVIAHELSHGVTEFTAGLAYHNQPGALNESVSDVFGSLVKQWSVKQAADEADWLIGTEVFSPGIDGDALRSMKNPGKAYDDPIIGRDPQPAHMDDFVQLPDTEEGDWGGVHINSGIPNHAFYLTATAIGGYAWEAPGHIWYETLKSAGVETDFHEFADKTYLTAGQLYGSGSLEQQAVQEAWRQVGIRIAGAVQVGDRLKGGGLKRDGDIQALLIQQIEALTKEVTKLSKEIAQLNVRK
jgi:Zn-dependent metalloprotease